MQAIDAEIGQGRVVGTLAAGEDAAVMIALALGANERALAEPQRLCVHADAYGAERLAVAEAERTRKRARLAEGRLKRYVLRIETQAGSRIAKVAETTTIGNALLGVRSSVARREHDHHARAWARDLALVPTLGFCEWRRGMRLVRAVQLQMPLLANAVLLDRFLQREAERLGDQAFMRFGKALAATHAVPFFHADLKGFHAYVAAESDPDAYWLRYIDFARVSFGLSPRQRRINLYQALRFIVPERREAQEAFIGGYCQGSGFCAAKPERALASARRWLAVKRVTHPVVE